MFLTSFPTDFFQDLCSDGHGGLSLGSQSAALLHCNSSRELNCTVSVSFPPKSGLLLTLAHLSMASSPNCSEDSLQVVGQTFCGNRSDQSETNQALQVLVEPGNPGSKVDVELLSLNNPTANFTLVLTTYTEGKLKLLLIYMGINLMMNYNLRPTNREGE